MISPPPELKIRCRANPMLPLRGNDLIIFKGVKP